MGYDINDLDYMPNGKELKDKVRNGEMTIQDAYKQGVRALSDSGANESVMALTKALNKSRAAKNRR